MSNKLMSTAPGGESTAYESKNTINQPSDKQGGQLGEPETKEPASQSQSSQQSDDSVAKSTRNETEKGMGGHTRDSFGEANTDGGLGGTKYDPKADGAFVEEDRSFQGGDPGVDRTVGG